MDPKELLHQGDGLLIVHVQVDFCPGGALPAPEGDKVVPVLNRWIEAAQEKGIPVYASRDWHPHRHVSFEKEGGQWPPHCLQDSPGARFHPDLRLPENVVKVTSGTRFDFDQYSAFKETGFTKLLRKDGIKRLWLGGLVLEYCVLESALGARDEGFEVGLIKAGTRSLTPEGERDALEKLRAAGVQIL
ncbi:MAG: isochorismatase family protein [Desulfuromonadales bacterium]|jgi:nicotinamidase/pyrazinamidase